MKINTVTIPMANHLSYIINNKYSTVFPTLALRSTANQWPCMTEPVRVKRFTLQGPSEPNCGLARRGHVGGRK